MKYLALTKVSQLKEVHRACVQSLGICSYQRSLFFLFLCLLPPLQLFDSLHFEEIPFHLSKPVAAYEEALQLVKEGKVACRTLR